VYVLLIYHLRPPKHTVSIHTAACCATEIFLQLALYSCQISIVLPPHYITYKSLDLCKSYDQPMSGLGGSYPICPPPPKRR